MSRIATAWAYVLKKVGLAPKTTTPAPAPVTIKATTMATGYLLPIGTILQFFTDQGVVLAGGKIYTYTAGTTTPVATYTSSTLVTPNANPIILGSSGRLPASCWVGTGVTVKMVLQDSSGNVISGGTIDNLQGINDPAYLTAAAIGLVLYPRTTAEINASITPSNYQYPSGNVLRYGADPTGGSDAATAFNNCWLAIKETGGTVSIPPGTYKLYSTWLCAVSQTTPFNYLIQGYGATLTANASVTGYAMQVYGGFNNFGVRIEGIHFDHQNNSTINGCIQGLGSAHLRVVKCSMEAYNTQANYAGIDLGPITPGNNDTNSFWTLIDEFTTRQRSGGSGTLAAVGVRLRGTANATQIIHCGFTNVVDAVRFDSDGVSTGLANGCVISANNFEGVTNAVTINTASPITYNIFGLKVTQNRCESTTTFLNITGAAVLDPSFPLQANGNYLTAGSVTNYIVNPNSQIVFTNESFYYGSFNGTANTGGQISSRVYADGTGNNFNISNFSNTSSWVGAHLVMGGYHYWTDASGRLRIKGGAPTSDTDGTVVGTQS